jgi:hypothetical protein
LNHFDFETASVSETEAVIIEGGPGTGKTSLLLSRLRYWHNNPRFVQKSAIYSLNRPLSLAYICFNVLAAQKIKKWAFNHQLSVEVWSFHNYCEHLVELQGLDLDSVSSQAESENDYFEHVLPQFALLYLQKTGHSQPWDALVIDGLEDFRTQVFWDIIQASSHVHSSRWLSWDPGLLVGSSNPQALNIVNHFKPNFPTWKLERNLRSEKPIFDELIKFKPWTDMISGSLIDRHNYTKIPKIYSTSLGFDNAFMEAINQMVDYGIPTNEIVILGLRSIFNAKTKGLKYYTVGQFKGCESKAVILVGFEDKATNPWVKRNYFHAISRCIQFAIEIINEKSEKLTKF